MLCFYPVPRVPSQNKIVPQRSQFGIIVAIYEINRREEISSSAFLLLGANREHRG
jgi:hypothetical protein